MFFGERSNLPVRSFYKGEPATLGEFWDQSWDDAIRVSNFNAHLKTYEESFDRIADRVKAATGDTIDNPFRTGGGPLEAVDMLTRFSREAVDESAPLIRWRERVRELQKKHPDKLDWNSLIDEPGRVAYATRREVREKTSEMSERAGLVSGKDVPVVGSIPVAGPIIGALPAFAYNMVRNPLYTGTGLVAGFGAQMTSPADAAINLISFGIGGTAKSLITNALLNASANMAGQAVLSAPAQLANKSADLPYGWQVWAEDVAAAGAGGFALDLGVRSINRALLGRFGRNTPAGTLFSRNTPRGGLFRDAPEPVAPIPGTIVQPPDIDPELIAKAQDGDLDAMQAVLQQATGTKLEIPQNIRDAARKAQEGDLSGIRGLIDLEANPSLKGALDRLEIEGLGPDPIERLQAELKAAGQEGVIDDGSTHRRILQALKSIDDPDEPPPVRGVEVINPERVPDLASDADLPPGRTGSNQHVRQIEIDGRAAEVRRIDLKQAEIAQGLRGLSERVRRLEGDFDAARAERVIAFQPKDGALQIMDGRARAELAARGEAPAEAEAVIFRESEGWTADEVATQALIKNLREGRADLMETARALRTYGDTLDGLMPVVTDFDMHARSLASLSDPAWQMVEDGEVHPMMASMVGEYVADPTRHAGVLRDIGRAGITDVDVARRTLGDLLPSERTVAANDILLGVRREDGEMPLRAGAEVDDPAGPQAKAQRERLMQELAPEVAEAQKRVAEIKGIEDELMAARQRLVALEVTEQQFREISRERPPVALTEWLIGHGGLADDAMEVRHVIGAAKQRPGLVSKTGMTLDDAALRVWEAGYLPGPERPTIAALLDAIDEDVNRGNRIYSIHDQAKAETINALSQMDRDLEFLGDARLEVRRLEGDLAVAEGRLTQEARHVADLIARDMDVNRALAEVGHLVPDGFEVRTFSSASALPVEVQAAIQTANAAAFKQAVAGLYGARTPEARARALAEMQRAASNQSIEGLVHDGRIWIAAYAVDPKSVMAHETVHALKVSGRISDAEIAILAKAARDEGLFNDALYRDTLDGRANVEGLLDEEAAAHLIQARKAGGDFGARANGIIDRLLQFIERVRNALRGRGFTTADEVIDAVLNGDMARREAVKVWMRQEDVTAMSIRSDDDRGAGQSMRRDLDDLGYYSKALEAARGLKQAKGTPEQMLAQLKKAGVKDAEIEATGLKGALDGKSSITRDEIIAHLEANRVGLREKLYSRGDDFDNQLQERMEEWREEIRQQVVFDEAPARDYYRFWENEKAVDDAMEFLDREGVQLDRDAVEVDGINIFERAGVKVTVGNIGVWHDHNGHFFVVEAPNGRALMLSEFDSNPTVHPSKADAIAEAEGEAQRNYMHDLLMEEGEVEARMREEIEPNDPTKWSSYSLDPSNPTYRETVLHLPDRGEGQETFRSGHFPEPNIIGHMMTSMTTHEGRPVFTIDQIQSDWGQKLRDGGARDEAKIADLEKQLADADYVKGEISALQTKIFGPQSTNIENYPNRIGDFLEKAKSLRPEFAAEIEAVATRYFTYQRLNAELGMAKTAALGHPLVNTTDQWVNTTLRRAIRQAAEANADYIAIPHGDTVLSYNPGDEAGMRGFYGSRETEGIVPKNLRKLIEKIDPKAPKPIRTETLDSPSGKTGLGKGFTLFPLTDAVKQSVMQDGQPMFAFAGEHAKTADLNALARAKEMEAAGRSRDDIWNATGWFKLKDGKWRFEVSDDGARFRAGKLNAPRLLRNGLIDDAGLYDIMGHDELYAAYPDLRDLTVVRSASPEGDGAAYVPSLETIELGAQYLGGRFDTLEAILHETQHRLQQVEGFSSGNSTATARPVFEGLDNVIRARDTLVVAITDALARGVDDANPTLVEAKRGLQDIDAYIDHESRFEGYRRTLGEVEARAVEKRLRLTEDERRDRPPWLDFDVPEEKQIVRLPDDPMFAIRAEPPAPDPARAETADRLMALARRILRPAAAGGERAVMERDAGTGLVSQVTLGEQAYQIRRNPDGSVADIAEVTPETTATLATLVQQIGAGAGLRLDDADATRYANSVLDVVRNATADQGAMMSRIVDLVQDMMTPPEPVARAANDNAIPTPLQRDLADIQRMEEAGTLVSVCRA